MLKRVLVSTCFVLFASIVAPVSATENMYVVVSGGFSDAEFADSSVDGATYKFAIGHQFHPQWYVEGGYQRIADEGGNISTQGISEVLEGDALFLSVLGKAGSRQGELFYRVGIMNADMQGYRENESCAVEVCIVDEIYDDSVIAGVFGFGYDWYVSLNSMVRFEIEHISGEDSLQVNAVHIGFRYNF